jgi:predicted DNA-binding transcriptional regulator AlpA
MNEIHYDPAGNVFLSSRHVRKRYNNMSDMSLWRWLNDEALNFPQPLRINRRRYWRLADLERWERERALQRGRVA